MYGFVESRVWEIGPYNHVDPRNRREGYSETRDIGTIESELREMYGFNFSFERHLIRVRKAFPYKPEICILDAGCGEGTALEGMKQLGEELDIPVRTTGVTLDRLHRGLLEGMVNEVVIGSVQNFFWIEDRRNYYHFILDYCGASSVDGTETIPIYGKILTYGGSALVISLNLAARLPFRENGLTVVFERAGCALLYKV